MNGLDLGLDLSSTELTIILAGVLALGSFLMALWIASRIRTSEPGQVLVVHRPGGSRISYVRTLVLPIIHRVEIMDTTVMPLAIQRHGVEGVLCRDNVRVDLTATFILQVNQTPDAILAVAGRIGCARASDPTTVRGLFEATFSEALKTVAGAMDFDELRTQRDRFRDGVIRLCDEELDGFCLQDLAIHRCEQTPVEALDPQNILDAKGIKKVNDIVAACAERTRVLEERDAEAVLAHAQDLAALGDEVSKLPS